MAKTLEEKMNHPKKPEVKLLKKRINANFPAGRMLIANPKVIDKTVRSVKKGKTITIEELREKLARSYRADYACPLTTGIFLRVVAENAELQRSRGASRIAPYWRVLQKDNSLNPKFPGGISSQARKLRAEGHEIVTKGKKKVVAD